MQEYKCSVCDKTLSEYDKALEGEHEFYQAGGGHVAATYCWFCYQKEHLPGITRTNKNRFRLIELFIRDTLANKLTWKCRESASNHYYCNLTAAEIKISVSSWNTNEYRLNVFREGSLDDAKITVCTTYNYENDEKESFRKLLSKLYAVVRNAVVTKQESDELIALVTSEYAMMLGYEEY